jgi:integrase
VASVRKSITAAGTTRWQAVWAEPSSRGATLRRTKNFATQKEARAYALRMEQEVERRGIGDPQKHNLERYLARWLATLADRGEYSPTTLEGYGHHIARACPHIGQIPLEKVSPADLDGLYTVLIRRGLTARTVLNVHRVLHTALEQARKWWRRTQRGMRLRQRRAGLHPRPSPPTKPACSWTRRQPWIAKPTP